jgi:predicted nucleotidyltransferase
MTLHDITIDDTTLAALCRDHGVRRLWLFGSITRDDFRADSDVDVLVETERPQGLFALGGLVADLQAMFGREVHLTTLLSVPPEARAALLAKAQLQYAA